jgi:hypothetical protein
MKIRLLIIALVALAASASYAQSTESPKKPVAPVKQEVLKIDWPAEYNWKVGSDQDDGKMHMIEVVPGNETVENWSIIGSLLAIKGVTGVPMDAVIQGTMEQQKKLDTAARMTILERNDTAKHPSILFKMESPTLHEQAKPGQADDRSSALPESEIFYFVQGETALFNAIVGVKQSTLSDDFVSKWKAIFRTSRLSVE